jgi:parvulin-like peptidyl-prolyl isomerase
MARLLLLLVVLAPLAGGCGRSPAVGADVVARIDRDDIHYAEFEDYLRANGPAADAPRAVEVQARLFDQFLDERLLRRNAVERGLVPPAASVRDAVEALLRADAPAEPSAADAEAFFGAHREQFRRPERVRLRQLVAASRVDAERAQTELETGEPFDIVARRYSRGPAAARGGDQGVLAREDLPAAFAERIFALAPGERTPVLEAEYGWLIFYVEDRLPAVEPAFAEAEPEVRAAMRREAADRALTALVAEARSRYTTVVYDENLPFRYRGPYADET